MMMMEADQNLFMATFSIKQKLTHHTFISSSGQRGITEASSSQGFTLVELLVVVVILGILSAVGVPAYLNQAQRARDNSANAAAMGAAKACAALLITQDESTFAPGEGVTPDTCAAGTSYTATVGDSTAIAIVNDDGSVEMTTRAGAETTEPATNDPATPPG